jgi:hypothetical protein
MIRTDLFKEFVYDVLFGNEMIEGLAFLTGEDQFQTSISFKRSVFGGPLWNFQPKWREKALDPSGVSSSSKVYRDGVRVPFLVFEFYKRREKDRI